jgi:lipid-A-disaccharide synthase
MSLGLLPKEDGDYGRSVYHATRVKARAPLRLSNAQDCHVTRIFFSAGEASGDIHGANLIRAIHALDPAVACEGLGGVRMQTAGMDLRCDLAGRAIMGFSEVVRSLAFIRRLFYETIAHLEQVRPDCLVVIDYPGFNLRLATKAHALNIPVVYYISPQVWAWKKKRIHTIAGVTRKVLVILPFEEPLYRNVGAACAFVGHPLVDHLASVPPQPAGARDCVIGLLPGSRSQEIARLLPVMIETARVVAAQIPGARFVCPCVDTARAVQAKAIAGDFPMEIGIGNTYDVLQTARFCMVASGTATLETAWFGVPMVVLYRVTPISYLIARTLVDVDHIALVNILSQKRAVPEFIQHAARPDHIAPVALELIRDTPARATMLQDLALVRERMGPPGASRRAAEEILEIAHPT